MSAVMERQSAWSTFWAEGPLHSLPGSLDDDLNGPVATFWAALFSRLTSDDHLLDIGTGNGALPRLALSSTGMQCPRIDAIDLSAIQPTWHNPDLHDSHRRIRFHAGIACEALPFADGTFSAVVSQFALEYSALDRAIPELLRVMKPKAHVALLMHHRASRLSQVAADEMIQLDALLQPNGFLLDAAQVLPWFEQIARGQGARVQSTPAATEARNHFNDSARQLLALQDGHPGGGSIGNTLALAAELIQRTGKGEITANDAQCRIEAHRQQLVRALLRNRELRDCALSENQAAELAQAFGEAGFMSPVPQPLWHGPHLLGWQLATHRPS